MSWHTTVRYVLAQDTFDPLKERRHPENPSRQRLLSDHGPAGVLVLTAGGVDILAGLALGFVGLGVLVLTANVVGYAVVGFGLALAALGTARAWQSSTMRADDVPGWSPRR